MATLLYRIGRLAFRRRGVVASTWFVLLAVLAGVLLALGSAPTSSVTIPGTESQRALEALSKEFPQASGASGTVVVRAPEGQTVVAIDSQSRFYVNFIPTTADDLVSRVQRALEGKKDTVVYVKGDKDARYASIMDAMDALRAARIDNIALITERRPDRSGRTNR